MMATVRTRVIVLGHQSVIVWIHIFLLVKTGSDNELLWFLFCWLLFDKVTDF